jgi:hypothetical protein
LGPEEALSLVWREGVMLASAKGPTPSLAEIVVGEPINGSWWAHRDSRQIFSVFRFVEDCPDILVCRLIGGKITFVHRRLWPALIRAAEIFPAHNLAKVDQNHTSAGHHVARQVPFPEWCDPASLAAAEALTLEESMAALDPGRIMLVR